MSDMLTDLEFLVLLAVLQVGDQAYGLAIQEALEEGADRKISVGSIYNTLMRMEERGEVASALGEPSPTRGGRAKRLYRVTPEGVEALRRTREAMDRMWKGAAVPERAG